MSTQEEQERGGEIVGWIDGDGDIWLADQEKMAAKYPPHHPLVRGFLDNDLAATEQRGRVEGAREERERLVAAVREQGFDVLIQHYRLNIRTCICGWSEPGKRYTRHVAHVLAEWLASLTPNGTEEGGTDG